MDRLRKLKPLGTFVGLALCAYLAAGIVTTLVAEWRRPVPPLPQIGKARAGKRFKRQISAIADRNLSVAVIERGPSNLDVPQTLNLSGWPDGKWHCLLLCLARSDCV